jgi:hypothetical protein
MQTLKIVALGTLFSVGGILLCVLDAILLAEVYLCLQVQAMLPPSASLQFLVD